MPFEERAKVVVGADGRESFVARQVGAAAYNEVEGTTAGYYAYAYTNRNYVGYKFRVRAYIGSNGYSIGSTSPWLYFMFV